MGRARSLSDPAAQQREAAEIPNQNPVPVRPHEAAGRQEKRFQVPGPRNAQRPTPASSQRTMLLPYALPLLAALPRPCAGVCKAAPGRADGTVMSALAGTHAPTLPRRAR